MITGIEQVVFGAGCRVVASSDEASPVFRWYVGGRFYREEVTGILDVMVPGEGVGVANQVRIDVFDQSEPGENLMRGESDGLEVRWDGVTGARSYRVDLQVGIVWLAKEEVAHDGSRSYGVVLRGLADETVHRVRVVALDEEGDGTTIYEHEGYLIRRPDVPSQTVVVSEGEVSVGG